MNRQYVDIFSHIAGARRPGQSRHSRTSAGGLAAGRTWLSAARFARPLSGGSGSANPVIRDRSNVHFEWPLSRKSNAPGRPKTFVWKQATASHTRSSQPTLGRQSAESFRNDSSGSSLPPFLKSLSKIAKSQGILCFSLTDTYLQYVGYQLTIPPDVRQPDRQNGRGNGTKAVQL
jgi:hypothetical protein